MPVEPTVAKVVLLLLHVPPVVVSPSAIDVVTHTFTLPVMVAGMGLTVSVWVILQPAGNV